MIQMISQVPLHSYSADFAGQETEAWRVWMVLDQDSTIRRSCVSTPEGGPGAQQRRPPHPSLPSVRYRWTQSRGSRRSSPSYPGVHSLCPLIQLYDIKSLLINNDFW